ncbi:MAG: GntR family transcriptional regulator [Flexilinea sp.]
METNHSINFESNIPYYIQLVELLKDQITAQKWHPGEQIPGEQELCSIYAISRTVVRQALGEMEMSGLINRRKGKGTFVSEPKVEEGLMQNLTGFHQEMTSKGFTTTTKVLHQSVTCANSKVATYLNIPVGSEVIEIQRLRFVDSKLNHFVTTYIPYDLCPELVTADLENCSLYEFLEKESGTFITRGCRYVEAVAANETEALLLGVERGSPLLLLDSVSYDGNGRCVEYYHALHRGDCSRFMVELVRSRESS